MSHVVLVVLLNGWSCACYIRDGSSMFSSSSIVEMDSVISSFDIFETQEVGLLILARAVFLCLVTSLPGKEEHNELMEIDHVGYFRQAFEAASLSFFLEILRNDMMDSDGPFTGYRSILRTYISAFVASYEIIFQLEDDTVRLILTILCEIYRGEKLLCVQFWDKDSVVDGSIHCLLCSLEGEFPYRTVELVRFLSALSEGSWPAECVGGKCDQEIEPFKNETYLLSYPEKMKILEDVMKSMETPVFYINVTRLTDYPKDAHPAVYRAQHLSDEERRSLLKYQDCSH